MTFRKHSRIARSATDWQHQLKAYWFAVGKPASLLAMWMGCGKSKVAIDLLLNWGCERVLILCPTSVRNVWRRELAKWAWDRFAVHILDKGTANDKAIWVQRARGEHPVVIVVSYDSAWRAGLGQEILSQTWDCVILDESHRCKSHNARISKFVMRLADKARRRLCLTGTPLPHSPLDVFGQYRFLDWRLFGKRWTPFKHRYAVCGIQSIPQAITGFQNQDELQERFNRIAFQVGADVLDLPPVSHHTRTFELPPKALRVYRDLERDFIAELEAGVVTAANVLVKTLRLRQIASGFTQPDEAEEPVELHTGKQALLADLLEDLGEPCVVFAEFRHDLAVIRRVAGRLKLTYGEVSGSQNDLTDEATIPTEIDSREFASRKFASPRSAPRRNQRRIAVLGVQYKSGGVGVDLSAVRYCILFSPTYSLGDYEQALARVHRPGQESHVHYYHLVAERTIDETVYQALDKKRDVIGVILKGGHV